MLQRSGMLRNGLTPRDQDAPSEADELDDIMEEDEEVESEVAVRYQH